MYFFRDGCVTDFCSCKIGIQYILYITSALRARQSLFKIAPGDFVEHGAYSQDVLYADFAGAKIGDAAIAEKVHF